MVSQRAKQSYGRPMRIMTYNVHGCVGVDRKLDVGRVAAVIAQCKPDVVALQELDVGRARSGGVDQAHAIASRLGMTFHFNSAMNVAEEKYGDAILTSLPMRLVRSGGLPKVARIRGLEPRGAVWVAIDAGDVELQVINTHLGLVPLEQRGQMACLLGRDWVGNPDCCSPAILLGDFNATTRYAVYRSVTRNLRDAQRQLGARRAIPTFPSRFPMLRIDHMFMTEGLRVVDVHAPAGPLAQSASDHLPLVADIELAAV
ncbi:MAG: endonuclease/exonuclease/phosphatase family protein [Caulobacteraceae bacterium]